MNRTTPAHSNESFYRKYRSRVEFIVAHERVAMNVGAGGNEIGIVDAWMKRYEARRWDREGECMLADAMAAALLVERNRQAEQAYSKPPQWNPIILTILPTMIRSRPNPNPHPADGFPALDGVHLFGPSPRQLWWRAVDAGASNGEAWAAVNEWTQSRPPCWEKDDQMSVARVKPRNPELELFLLRAMKWQSTCQLNEPWEGGCEAGLLRVRLNNFPDAYMYTLMAGNREIGDFHDWPPHWTRP